MSFDPPQSTDRRSPATTRITVVRGLDDFLKVAAIRSVAYLGGQDCPFDEEFDGNDFCGMHLLGWIGREPAASLRIRFFAGFAKVERLAVLPRFRRSAIAFEIVRFSVRIAARKGYAKIYGHAREGLESFWARFGAKPIGPKGAFAFSGMRYTEMVADLQPVAEALAIGSDPLVLIRPEGAWDEPGVLEASRQATARSADGRIDNGWSTNVQVAWLRWAGNEMAARFHDRADREAEAR